MFPRTPDEGRPIEPSSWRAMPFWVLLGAANAVLLAGLALLAFRQGEPRWAMASALTSFAITTAVIAQKRRIDRLKALLRQENEKYFASLRNTD